MILDGRCGERQGLEDGAKRPLRLGRDGELVTSQLHGKYYELASRGQVFVGRRSATLNDAGNVPQIGLGNPSSPVTTSATQRRTVEVANAKVLLPIRFEMVVTALDVTPSVNFFYIGYAPYGYSANTVTAVDPSTSILPALVGKSFLSAGRILSSAPSAAFFKIVGNELTGASTVSPFTAAFWYDFDGSCLLYPGDLLLVNSAGTTAPSGELTAQTVWVWAELDL